MDADRRAQLQQLLDGADPFEIAPGYLHQIRAEDLGELLADSARAEQLAAALAWIASAETFEVSPHGASLTVADAGYIEVAREALAAAAGGDNG